MLSPVYKQCPLCLCGSGPAWMWEGKKGDVGRDLSIAQSLCLNFSRTLSFPPCHLQVKEWRAVERTMKRAQRDKKPNSLKLSRDKGTAPSTSAHSLIKDALNGWALK